MSMNGSGVFVVNSAGQPVVASTLITSAAFNAFTADIATAMSTAIMKDGQTTITENIPFNNKKITGLAAATARTDAASIATYQDGTGIHVGSGSVGGTANAITLTPSPAITAYAEGQRFSYVAASTNTGAMTVAVSGLAAKSIYRNTTVSGLVELHPGDHASGLLYTIIYDGTRFRLLSALEVPRLPAQQSTTSGTSVDFPGLLAGIRRITIILTGVSTNGTSNIIIQLGDSGGIETTGYATSYMLLVNAGAVAGATSTAGFVVQASASASAAISGTLTLNLSDTAFPTAWTASGSFARTDTAAMLVCAGNKTLTTSLDRVRLTTAGGTDTFDAGVMNISFE
jgi:hypothetical protein